MRYSSDEETDDAEVEEIAYVPVKVDVEEVGDIPNNVEGKEGVAGTSQRPQITRVLPARLHDYKVAGDDEVTPD